MEQLDGTPRRTSVISRRRLLQAVGAVAGVGVAATAVEVLGASPAGASQSGWSFCSACRGLWWPSSAGACPANRGGRHTRGSRNYIMYTAGESVAAFWQAQWFYCTKCHLLFHGPNGWCPAGGQHTQVGSANYAVPRVPQAASPAQYGWKYCGTCHGLWYWNGSNFGACPTRGGHQVGSADYELRYHP